jgi:prepilin-type processing-associated H-X9-DG protein
MKFLIVFLFLSTVGVLAEQRGKQVEPRTIRNLISRANFESMFPNRANVTYCDGSSIYTYDAFAEAADTFGGFGTTGEEETRKREIAAFLAQTAYATAG